MSIVKVATPKKGFFSQILETFGGKAHQAAVEMNNGRFYNKFGLIRKHINENYHPVILKPETLKKFQAMKHPPLSHWRVNVN